MKRILTFSAMSLLLSGMALAAPLSPEQALARMQDSSGLPVSAGTRSGASMQLKYTMKAADGIPTVYVFDTDRRGFMILSADDAALPVLGYSDNGVFDPDNMPPALQGWLQGYQDQIEYMRLNGVEATRSNAIELPAWSPIAPMLKTTWDQNVPFNNLTPRVNGTPTPTGCVATAMSQVMKYFQYPDKCQDEKITYQTNVGTSTIPIYQTLSLNFGDITFDWADMLDNYPSNGGYTPAQANAVAVLMQAAGYSVQMNYGTSQSGAVSGYIPGALVKYFGYDPSALFVSRSQKTYTEWATLIYNNLKNVGPVIYDGDTAMSGGHSFVCDGYQGNGYFHFNWGWSGVSDGYYLLDALNPQALGTGGAAGGFNFRQDVVVNIQKPKAGSKPTENTVVLSGSVYGTSSSAYLYLRINGNQYTGFRYYGNSDIVFDVGAQFQEVNNPNAAPEYYKVANSVLLNYPLDPGYVCFCNGTGQYPFPMIQLSKLNLKDNTKYKVTTAYLPKGGEWQVAEASVGCYNYFYVTKTSSGLEFENFDVMEFDCEDLSPLETLYDGVAAELNLKLTNNNNTELTRGVMLYLLDAPEENANPVYYSDSFAATLAPGETLSQTWVTPLTAIRSTSIKVPTQFYMALYDMDTDMIYYIDKNPVTLNPFPGAPKYTVSVDILNERKTNGVYYVANSQDFETEVTISVTDGIFSESVNLYVLSLMNNGYFHFEQTYPLDLEIIRAGESYTYNTNIDFPGAELGTIYYIGVLVGNSNTLATREVPFVAESNEAGIEQITTAPEDGIYRVYNLQGMKVLETPNAYELKNLPKGLYIVNGKKILM